MKTFLISLISGIAGGFIVLIGFMVVLKWQLSKGDSDFTYLYVDHSKAYNNVEILSSENREGGIWVQCRNTGSHPAQNPLFKLSILEKGKLLAEYKSFGDEIPAGETTEQVLSFETRSRKPVQLGGREFKVSFISASYK